MHVMVRLRVTHVIANSHAILSVAPDIRRLNSMRARLKMSTAVVSFSPSPLRTSGAMYASVPATVTNNLPCHQ